MAYYRSYSGSGFDSYSGSNPYYHSQNSYSGYVYDPYLAQNPNYPSLTYSTIAYSATTFSDPKLIEYDPNLGMTQLVISYSNLEFNEPEFEEYDPTPYGGGYDLADTYGKPLPPSEEICYPRSGIGSKSFPASDVLSGAIVPIALPTVEEGIDDKTTKPQSESAPQVTEEMPKSENRTIDLPEEEEEEEEKDIGHDTEDLKPYESEYFSGSGNGYSGEQSYEHEKQVSTQFPSGYGLESLDLCESLFGYWPCLAGMKRRENCCHQVTDDGYYCREDMWKGTADYLFGNPDPYAYAYQRHYPSQAQYRQIEDSEDSW
ncbi:hypothetical protein L6164_036490 [Bauhinia variegata]|uniref:Uncharacterized protein n=1 Tax=Bauhinia variegata TaxID=167791 RepID=A0ACB9KHD6_BAUVA|nr:hypothetical protein L6164_036490 [Bauhinia variegata]